MKQIPLKEFFKNRSKSTFILSPDNTKVAYLDTYEKRRNIFVWDLETDEKKAITKQQKRNIYSFGWKNSDKLYYLQDNDGDENHHVFLVDLSDESVEDITPMDGVKVAGINDFNTMVNHKGREELRNKMLISHNDRDKSTFDPYIFDLETKEWTMLYETKANEGVLLSDEDTFMPVIKGEQLQGGSNIYDKDGNLLKFISSKDHFSIEGWANAEKTELYVSSNEGRDKVSLFKADINLNLLSEEPIFEDDTVDMGGIKTDFYTKKLQYVSMTKAKREVVWYDEVLEKKVESWKASFLEQYPNEKDSSILAMAKLGTNEKIIYFDTYSDKKLSDEYVWFVDQNKFIKFTEDEELLNPDNLVDMIPISYEARDGLTIHGYLTLPKDTKGPVPIIVNPHGGPWVRDNWGYNPEAQFFANRGFGWFQPNFRISTGYGKEHFTKGWHQWGLDCQHDVTDGTKWLIEQGYTEEGKVAIYGGSYGGYATLMGIINEPDLYSAAVDYVGVSDLFTFWDGFPPYWKVPGNIFEEAMGNPYDNPEKAKRISPVYRANEIKTPLMVVQGGQDPRVPKQQADQIVEAMQNNGVEVEYLLKEDEGHGFRNEENRFELYEKMLDFFNEHLK